MSAALFNARLIRTHVCAQCWGQLVERYLDNSFQVVCPRGCQPGGFVTREYADRRRAESHAQFAEVAHNYPQFDHRPPTTSADLEALFGKE